MTCSQDAEELGLVKKGVAAKTTDAMRLHTFTCARSAALIRDFDRLLHTFDQDQACPLCLEQESTHRDGEESSDFSLARSEARHRSPYSWSQHITFGHTLSVRCLCGQDWPQECSLQEAHMAREHDLWISQINRGKSKAEKYEKKLSIEHLPPPR